MMTDTVADSQGQVPQITMRPPSTHTLKDAPPQDSTQVLAAPRLDWLSGTWNVTHSTLPMWKGKQNVRITYSGLHVQPGATVDKMPDLDDHVEYQKEGSTKTSNIHGVSKPTHVQGVNHGLAYHWRGKGFLMVASSKWEILAYGTDTASLQANEYVVTYFGKTLFTPHGIDVYTRTTSKLSVQALNGIKEALAGQSNPAFTDLAKTLFEIPHTAA